jgi:hypothetical protein
MNKFFPSTEALCVKWFGVAIIPRMAINNFSNNRHGD